MPVGQESDCGVNGLAVGDWVDVKIVEVDKARNYCRIVAKARNGYAKGIDGKGRRERLDSKGNETVVCDADSNRVHCYIEAWG